MNHHRVQQLQQLLKAEPNDCFLHHALGVEYLSCEKYDDAIAAFRKVLSLDENYLASYYQLGDTLVKTGATSEAMQIYKIGIEIAKKQGNAKAFGELSQALWLLED